MSDVQEWLEDNGYEGVVGIYDAVVICLHEKMSENDVLKFNDDFNCKLKYRKFTGKYLKNNGAKRPAHVDYDEIDFDQYSFSPPLIDKIRHQTENWLNQQELDGNLFISSLGIGLVLSDELDANQIEEFEKQLNVKHDKSEKVLGSDLIIFFFDYCQ